MEKSFELGAAVFLVIAEAGVLLGAYFLFKNIKINPEKNESLWDASVNNMESEGKNTSLRIFCVVWLLIMIYIAYRLHEGMSGSSTGPLMAALLTPPLTALFYLRKRTGKSLFVLLCLFTGALTSFLIYLSIGLPAPVPVLNISGYDVRMGQTTKQELENNGFSLDNEQPYYNGSHSYQLFSDGELIGKVRFDEKQNEDVAPADFPIVYLEAERETVKLSQFTLDKIKVTEVTEEALRGKYGKKLKDVPKFRFSGDDLYWVRTDGGAFWPSYDIKWQVLPTGITVRFEITCILPE